MQMQMQMQTPMMTRHQPGWPRVSSSLLAVTKVRFTITSNPLVKLFFTSQYNIICHNNYYNALFAGPLELSTPASMGLIVAVAVCVLIIVALIATLVMVVVCVKKTKKVSVFVSRKMTQGNTYTIPLPWSKTNEYCS